MTDTAWFTSMSASDTLSESRATINTNLGLARKWTVAPIDNTDSPYTAADADMILCDCTSGNITVNLPASASASGHAYTIKKTDAGAFAVTVDANGSETIDGATTRSLTSQHDSLTIVADGSGWQIAATI